MGIGRPWVRWGGGKLWAGPDVLPVALQGRSDAVAMEEVAVLVEGRARMILPAPFEPVPDVLGLGPEARPPGLEALGLNGVFRGVAREPVAEVGDGAGVARIDRALEVLGREGEVPSKAVGGKGGALLVVVSQYSLCWRQRRRRRESRRLWQSVGSARW